MKRIDVLLTEIRKRKNPGMDKQTLEFLEYSFYEMQCDYLNIPIDREPPNGYEDWLHQPVEPPDPRLPDYEERKKAYDLMAQYKTEFRPKLTER